MEFNQERERYCEMEKKVILREMGKHPFQFSPSSSSSSYTTCSPSQYKGLFVPQPNSRWGAQIHENHQRMWLGTENDFTNSNKIEFVDLQTGSSSDDGEGSMEREHMFDKVVTPSDVGKLNRLVIPKQHAEKYFPLDSSANEKGLLLNFEDRCGKPWRFRYSYWNSSQSYVMTKGWSRFVKEKKLNAGDVVSFERGVGESAKDRLYIDWKRRTNAAAEATFQQQQLPPLQHQTFPWVRSRSLLMPPSHMNYGQGSCTSGHVVNPSPVFYLRTGAAAGSRGNGNGVLPMVFSSVPVVQGKVAAAKRLRLFGVNLECPTTEDADGDILLSSSVSEAMVSSLSPQTPSLPSLQLRLFNGSPLEDLSGKGSLLCP